MITQSRYSAALVLVALMTTVALVDAQQEFSWTGFYLGGAIGGNFTTYDLPGSFDSITTKPLGLPPTTITLPVGGLHKTDGSLLGGGQLGYNLQFGVFVIGLEGDFNGTSSDVSQSFVFASAVLPPFNTLTAERTVESSWMASARLRAGVALHSVLLYATGGGAFTDVTVHADDSFTGNLHVSSSSADITAGWTVGGGVEWAITKAVSVGLEYRHSDYGTNTYNIATPGAPISAHSVRAGVTTDQALFRVNLLFNGLMGHSSPEKTD